MTTRAGRAAKMAGTPEKVAGARRRKSGRATGKPDGKALPATALRKLVELGSASDFIELKLSVPAPHHRATIRGLGLDPVEAQPRQAYFFDTPDLRLSKAGLVLRARRIQGGRADTVIKIRPVDPVRVDPELRRSESFKVELDVVPGGFVCSASFKGVCTGKEVLDMTAGKLPLRSIFSKEQRAFYKAHAPTGLKLKDLVTLGPTFLLRAKHVPKDFPRGITVEMWLYPDGSRILEISTKALPEEAFQAAAEFRAFLGNVGVDVNGKQETKTRTMLEFYSRELAAHPPEKSPIANRKS